MAGAELLGDLRVVLAARVGVADQQRDRRAGGEAFVDAAEDLDLVGLVPLRGVARRAGGAALEVVAEVVRRDRDARRAAVDHAADRRAVAFAEGGDANSLPKVLLARGPGAGSDAGEVWVG